jgi:hypothetical protein
MMGDVLVPPDLAREIAGLWLLACSRRRDAHRMESNARATRDEAMDIEAMAKRLEGLLTL